MSLNLPVPQSAAAAEPVSARPLGAVVAAHAYDALFPGLAEEWKQISNATYGLNHFSADDFRKLKSEYSAISWTAIHGTAPAGMVCPYQHDGFAVCQIPN
jgi:hypothetical protein